MSALPPMSEPEVLKRLVDINVDFQPVSPYPKQRSEHGKGVADLRATFTVLEHVPTPYKIGLFEEPGTYDAIVRFSNGSKQKDSQRDTHGMAVKVLNVPMRSAPKDDDGVPFQDFVLMDSPIFVMGNLRNYIPFARWFLAAKISLYGKLRLGLLVLQNLRWVPSLLRMSLNKANAPLSTSYWSTTPYQLGSHVVKYKSVPVGPAEAPPITGENGRRVALRAQLDKGPGVFTFGVIVQSNTETQPLENPRIDWEKNGARFMAVAEIRIPSDQDVAAPVEMENALSYSPGHASVEHFPLGAINRARVAIYSATTRARLAEVAKDS